ncbi:cytoplasmic [NiFe]-hydrogenase, iron-sulfur cluster-binding subunit [Geotalea daltonii FRC-32]|uniref:Cytoplasmic [NiFe]-hydrogenase, iron-sulfur cluster-binding subunit n=1 Tax=Geotalea daltonii (strain DSM 22248 / JCM 15807 / FRC-32) TaxID=316067 RepID=B9M7G3_GEODF|nr:4Fe-4S dicluster domain-containing protein [Geotalea daltonii]ACM20251.1 cytoplasmic [NiFe]-hydrogenase, iron-sulfur cluster-binding subunit [Geotalea daltonii FRC-32]
MADKFLASESLEDFLSDLMQIGTLHGPTINRQGVLSFNPVSSIFDLNLDYHRTLLPPKKYLLPPKTTILQFESGSGYTQATPPNERTVLFGLHACDLASIAYLDRVFLEDRPDPIYQSRRNRLVLVGISCKPDEFCFCGELGIESSSVPYDLFLAKGEGGFIVLQGSQLGAEIIAELTNLTEITGLVRKTAVAAETAAHIDRAVQRHETFDDSPLWDDFARRCLSCGACSLCCPTCYCLDVREYGALDGQTATRIQEWDNCLFKAHGEVTGGINFRKTRQERFRYRFLHKYYGFGPLRGVISCVGCGRCREVCPVRIDLLELFCEQRN